MAMMTIKTNSFLISPTKKAGIYNVQSINYVVPGYDHAVYSRPAQIAIPAELFVPARCHTIFDDNLNRFINKELDRCANEGLKRILAGGVE